MEPCHRGARKRIKSGEKPLETDSQKTRKEREPGCFNKYNSLACGKQTGSPPIGGARRCHRTHAPVTKEGWLIQVAHQVAHAYGNCNATLSEGAPSLLWSLLSRRHRHPPNRPRRPHHRHPGSFRRLLERRRHRRPRAFRGFRPGPGPKTPSMCLSSQTSPPSKRSRLEEQRTDSLQAETGRVTTGAASSGIR